MVNSLVNTLMRALNLRLMFPIEQVKHWASKYADRKEDAAAFEAGKRIRDGDCSRKNLEEIVEWKSDRRKALIADNTDDEIRDALTLALTAKQPRSALAVLIGLSGVALPMASAIMTAMDDQDRYTIVDWRALEALGEPEADYSRMTMYLHEYLPTCRRIANDASVSLRTLDRALWAWSEKKDREA